MNSYTHAALSKYQQRDLVTDPGDDKARPVARKNLHARTTLSHKPVPTKRHSRSQIAQYSERNNLVKSRSGFWSPTVSIQAATTCPFSARLMESSIVSGELLLSGIL